MKSSALVYSYGEASYAQRSAEKLTVGVASRREGIALKDYQKNKPKAAEEEK
ncbi:MAG: hypothetical protein V7L25_33705 [Nostoc sp.]|uniref:hypothetical protein n=1 Tax=Nostoc sp. TaxID=1180 RepID=UPI002FF11C36